MEKKKEPKSVFEVLNAIDCSQHIEKKGQLSYLSWAWAWQIVKQHYPDATYTIYRSPHPVTITEGGRERTLPAGLPYQTDGKTCWVETGVTIGGVEHIECLPVMDNRNSSVKLEYMTSMDMNKAIQRSLTKAVARHGLGLYIYAGEDLPEASIEEGIEQAAEKIRATSNMDELKTIWNEYTPMMNSSQKARNEITALLTKRKSELLTA
ncbi:MAG: DUF1071 domain-containing protein [Fibrobacter sp.]|nr:DUF1071 domain-containing protein [Fibrobacter sp.]